MGKSKQGSKLEMERLSDAPEGSAFIPGIGTVRICLNCDGLVAGGPTRCTRCVRNFERRYEWGVWDRLIGVFRWVIRGYYGKGVS